MSNVRLDPDESKVIVLFKLIMYYSNIFNDHWMVSMSYIKNMFLLQMILLSNTACADDRNQIEKNKKSENIEYFKVVSVNPNDTLNLRVSPGVKSKIVSKLPYTASGILKLNDSNGWMKLSYKEHVGWASGKYLKEIPAPSVKPKIQNELFCLGTEPHWILKTNVNNLTYKKYDNERKYMFNSSIEEMKRKSETWLLSAVNIENNDQVLNVLIKSDGQCSDEMSDTKYTYSIRVTDNDMDVLNGCCK